MKLNITNRGQIIEQLAEMLKQFDKDCNNYDTDVYLYYDEENQTAKLDTFVNVGGNSWLDDSHYTIYTDKQHHDDGIFSWIQNENEFADMLEIPDSQFEEEVREYLEYDKDDQLTYSDYREYIESMGAYMEKLTEAYNEAIDDMRSDYVQSAEEIMNNFDEWCESIED